jgi:hypothetical protein
VSHLSMGHWRMRSGNPWALASSMFWWKKRAWIHCGQEAQARRMVRRQEKGLDTDSTRHPASFLPLKHRST